MISTLPVWEISLHTDVMQKKSLLLVVEVTWKLDHDRIVSNFCMVHYFLPTLMYHLRYQHTKYLYTGELRRFSRSGSYSSKVVQFVKFLLYLWVWHWHVYKHVNLYLLDNVYLSAIPNGIRILLYPPVFMHLHLFFYQYIGMMKTKNHLILYRNVRDWLPSK